MQAILAGCLVFAGVFAAHAAPLEVRIVDGADKPIADAWVGIARPDGSWGKPEAEAMTTQNGVATFDLQEGTWRIAAGAVRYFTNFEHEVSLGPGGEKTTIRLSALGSVGGRVRAVTGEPLADARIGMFWEFLDDHPRALSPKGRSHLLANTLVESDAEGFFELPVPLNRATVVIIEADGMSPIAVDGVGSGSSALADLRLHPGSELRVQWTERSRFDVTDRISVIPIESFLAASLPEHRAAAMWRRPATAPVWKSLPAGTFDVLLHRHGHATPIALQRVTLAPGEKRRLQLQAPVPGAGATGRIHRFLVQRTDADESFSGTRWRSHRPATFHVETKKYGNNGVLSVESDCVAGDRWIWSSTARLGSATISDCRSPTTIVPMRSRAELSFRLEPPRNTVLPHTAAIAGFDCATNAAVDLEFAVRHGVNVVPFVAGCTAATLRVPGFRQVATGRLDLKPGERRELPAVQLQAASSILARVTDADGLPKAGADVHAVRAREFANVRSLDALASLPAVAKARTDTKGWARLDELPNDPLMLLVFAVERKYPELAGPHEVLAGEERIDEIVLRPPATVRITLNRVNAEVIGSAAVLAPAEEEPWPRGMTLQALLGPDSTAVFEAVPPGTWVASAQVRAPGGTVVTVGRERVDAFPGMSTSREIELGDALYRGRITGSGELINGFLTLQPIDPLARVASQTTAIREGRFAAVFERGGQFAASIQTADSRWIPISEPVSFDSPDQEVLVRLSEGRISGRVQNAQGKPVANARVNAVRQYPGDRQIEALATSRSDGTFELEGIDAGRWKLRAAARGERSEALSIDVVAGQKVAEVSISLQPFRTIRARVRNSDGTPAAAAVVAVYLYSRPFDNALLSRTNETGELTLEILSIDPEETNLAANVMVIASDRSLSSHHVQLRDEMAVILPTAYGAARIRRNDRSSWDEAALRHAVLVAEDGSWIYLNNAGHIREGVFEIPRLAAGRWRFGIAQPSIVRSGHASSIPPAAAFVIDPAATADVTLK